MTTDSLLFNSNMFITDPIPFKFDGMFPLAKYDKRQVGLSPLYVASGNDKNNAQIHTIVRFNHFQYYKPFIVKKSINFSKNLEEEYSACTDFINNKVDKIWVNLLRASSTAINYSFIFESFTYKVLGAMIGSIVAWDSLPECLVVSKKVWADLIKLPNKEIVPIPFMNQRSGIKDLFQNVHISFHPCMSKLFIQEGYIGYFELWNQRISVISDFIFRKKSVLISGECFLLGKKPYGEYIEHWETVNTTCRKEILMSISKPQLVVHGVKGVPKNKTFSKLTKKEMRALDAKAIARGDEPLYRADEVIKPIPEGALPIFKNKNKRGLPDEKDKP